MNNEMLNRVQADIKRKIGCRMGKMPAPLFGEGFSEEMRKITTLTKYLELETWTPVEAAMLVCGLQPPQDCHEIPQGAKGLENVMVMPYEDRFRLTKRVLQLWNSRENPPNKIRPADFVAWCKTKGINTDWLRDVQPAESQPEAVPETAGRKDMQIMVILAHGKSLGYDIQSIPRGGKRAIKELCLNDTKKFTESSFNDAWKKAASKKLLRVQNAEIYGKRN